MFSKFLKVFFQKIKKLEIKYGLHRMLTLKGKEAIAPDYQLISLKPYKK